MSDIHGNAVALRAVVADALDQGVERWWVLGDLVAIGPDPVETLDLLMELPAAKFVRGNTDRYVLTGERPPPGAEDVLADSRLLRLYAEVEASFSWTRGFLSGHGRLDALGQLADCQRTTLPDGSRLLGVHASPRSDDGFGITPRTPEDLLTELLEGAEADVVCGGHTHQATDRTIGAVRAVNLGSVSNPITDDLRASYVIVHADRHGHAIEHRRVAYDHDAVIDRIRRCGHPSPDYLASFQRGDQARFPAERLAGRPQ